jgi:hypothetical protein
MAVDRGVDGRWIEGPVGEYNAPRSFEERGGGWDADWGRRAETKAPRSFEESGVGNGRWMEGPVSEDMLS